MPCMKKSHLKCFHCLWSSFLSGRWGVKSCFKEIVWCPWVESPRSLICHLTWKQKQSASWRIRVGEGKKHRGSGVIIRGRIEETLLLGLQMKKGCVYITRWTFRLQTITFISRFWSSPALHGWQWIFAIWQLVWNNMFYCDSDREK